jgi:glycosyltransferase involved in cell wall biosynthesis
LKIVIVSASELHGGAARAAYRLHKSLLLADVNSTMIVQKKCSDDYTVITPSSKFKKLINELRPALDHIIMIISGSKVLFSSSYLPFSGIIDKVNSLNPDIVHLHWVAGGTVRIEDLGKINAPVVWNLQDMWPFTGGCHYTGHCTRYENNCGKCEILDSNKENDLSKRVFKRKIEAYKKLYNLTIVGVSRWISGCAKSSFLFHNNRVLTIPNCFDTDLLKPIDKSIARDIFGIPNNKKVILFAAMNSLDDPRKGAVQLLEALNLLELEDVVFVIAGSSKPEKKLKLKYPVYFIPPLSDETSLPMMYNTADVVIVPSLQENLANSIIESLSCGIPVIAFNIGGNADMIDHKINGYLANKLDVKDMAYGITWILDHDNYIDMSIKSREKVLSFFDRKIVVKQYINLYKEILEGGGGS